MNISPAECEFYCIPPAGIALQELIDAPTWSPASVGFPGGLEIFWLFPNCDVISVNNTFNSVRGMGM